MTCLVNDAQMRWQVHDDIYLPLEVKLVVIGAYIHPNTYSIYYLVHHVVVGILLLPYPTYTMRIL